MSLRLLLELWSLVRVHLVNFSCSFALPESRVADDKSIALRVMYVRTKVLSGREKPYFPGIVYFNDPENLDSGVTV